jgi:hypothetical protein
MFDELCKAAKQVEPDLRQELIDYNTERTSHGSNREMFRPGVVLKENKEEVFKTFVDNVSSSDKKHIYPDAERLLKRKEELGAAAVLLTFGDQEWQRAKIDATLVVEGYNLPVIYTEDREKSNTILKAWSDENQEYDFGSETAPRIIGIGDEHTDFTKYENLPNAKGYRIVRKEKSEPVMLSENVVEIHSLDEIVLSE